VHEAGEDLEARVLEGEANTCAANLVVPTWRFKPAT
jgi:hypothetical protein